MYDEKGDENSDFDSHTTRVQERKTYIQIEWSNSRIEKESEFEFFGCGLNGCINGIMYRFSPIPLVSMSHPCAVCISISISIYRYIHFAGMYIRV